MATTPSPTPSAALVLVTGGTGYLAGHCIAELLDAGYRVRTTVRDPDRRDRYAHLPRQVEVVAADLTSDDGWEAAVDGCSYVLHVASPFPSSVPKNEDELIAPAVDGTLRVLRAAAANDGVRRVVLTSSIAAIVKGHDSSGTDLRTEADWSVVDDCSAYEKSKTLAERAAWDHASRHGQELVVLNPGLILGPLLHAAAGTSVEVVRMLASRDVPGVLRLGFAPVDVRDLATAHRLAMESPQAAGNRYILAGDNLWMRDLAAILAAHLNPQGYKVPTRQIPYVLAWLIARFDPTVRLALPMIGRPERVSATKARAELGWSQRPVEQTLHDTADSLIEHGLVPRRTPSSSKVRSAASSA